MRVRVVLIASIMLLGACAEDLASPSVPSTSPSVPSSTSTSTPTTTRASSLVDDSDVTATVAPEVSCTEVPRPVAFDEPPATDVATLVELSGTVFPCTDSVVLVDRDAPELWAEASRVASGIGAPLFPIIGAEIDERVLKEIDRLGATRVRVYGDVSTAALIELPGASRIDRPGILQSPTAFTREARAVLEDSKATELALVVVRPGDAEIRDLVLVAPLVEAAGARMVVTDPGTDAGRSTLAALGAGDIEVVLPPGLDVSEQWRIDVALSGVELPGGGIDVFPDRRLLAFYGNPLTSALGVLGEQDPHESLERIEEMIDTYQRPDQPPIQPAFEIIATVAAASPTENGDYSRELNVEQLREWLDVAQAEDFFVILDLQPGRDDFLTQAKQYEEFLRLPNVGLALDPEWRLGPTDLPLQRVGTVGSDEVNSVVDWLTELVREHTLPQKLLVLHQFQRRMLQNREKIRTPPELAVVVHVDGQGSLAAKYGTWASMLSDEIAPEQTLWWGWKNFFDEDRPMANPDQVNELEPLPLIVTFQ